MSGGMGNPAPTGLMAFALTIFMLGALDAGLVETGTKELLSGFGFWWAGWAQVGTGILELYHGKTYPCMVFCTYGFLWVSLATVWHGKYEGVLVGHAPKGECLMLLLFGFATVFFFIISLRKNRALQVCLALVAVTCFLLAIGNHSDFFKKAGGWCAMATGCSAFYILVAELVNEEWGRAIMPGLEPMVVKEQVGNKPDFRYDAKANILHIKMAGVLLLTKDSLSRFKQDMEEVFKTLVKGKCHVVANYSGFKLGDSIKEEFHDFLSAFAAKNYLSVKRFTTNAFPDSSDNSNTVFFAKAPVGAEGKKAFAAMADTIGGTASMAADVPLSPGSKNAKKASR